MGQYILEIRNPDNDAERRLLVWSAVSTPRSRTA